MARELHDAYGQKMALINLQASEIEALLPSRPGEAAEKLRACRKKISGVAQEIQEFARQLHPSVLHELGLEVALRSEGDAYGQRTGTKVNFLSGNIPETIPENIALCLYRVAQESLQNIWKHAESNRVDVMLRATKEQIELIVEDFGKGFDVEATKGRGGLGLISMQERVRLVGGSLSINSKAGDGARVEVRIPLRRD
jgi:signal transduction histidine kinase